MGPSDVPWTSRTKVSRSSAYSGAAFLFAGSLLNEVAMMSISVEDSLADPGEITHVQGKFLDMQC